jgi:hypothetical protein
VTTVDCPVTTCVPVVVKTTRKVCKTTPVQSTVEVTIHECKPVEMKGTRKVCKIEKETVMVDVTVNECKPVVMKGTKKVCTLEPSKETREEKYIEMVAVERTVQVSPCAETTTCCKPAPAKKCCFSCCLFKCCGK